MKNHFTMDYKISPDTLEWTNSKVNGFAAKELINLKNGSVKLIEVSPNSSYPRHKHPDKTEYALILEGVVDFKIDTMNFKGQVGDFIIFPTNVNHAIINSSETICKMLIGSIAS